MIASPLLPSGHVRPEIGAAAPVAGETDGTLTLLGMRIAFVATFLGRRLVYTYQVTEFVPGERLVMRTTDGPFAMETTYLWEDNQRGTTRMNLRNRGEPSGFSGVAAPMMELAMRRANRRDLRRLKALLESAPG